MDDLETLSLFGGRGGGDESDDEPDMEQGNAKKRARPRIWRPKFAAAEVQQLSSGDEKVEETADDTNWTCMSCDVHGTNPDRANPLAKQVRAGRPATVLCIDCEIFRKNDVEACKHTPAKFAKEIKRNTELREKRDHYLPRIARQRAETAGKRKYVTKNEFGRFSPPKTTITKTKEGYSDLQQEDLVANYAQWCKAHKGKDPLAEGWTIDWLDSPDGEKIKILKKPKQVDDAGVPLMTMAAGRRHGVQLSEVHGVMEDAPEGLGDTHAIFESNPSQAWARASSLSRRRQVRHQARQGSPCRPSGRHQARHRLIGAALAPQNQIQDVA